jgi:hypothetical protein
MRDEIPGAEKENKEDIFGFHIYIIWILLIKNKSNKYKTKTSQNIILES